jgi:flagellar P-ring protein precursor FlgI
VGGFSFGGEAASAQRNHPTVGRIPNGGIVEREVPTELLGIDNDITVCLRERSFLTAERLARAITEALPVAAIAEDAATVRIAVPEDLREKGKLVSLIARIGELDVRPDVDARVVVNERTGTIVVGEHVRVSRVEIAHGSLTITISEEKEVTQGGGLVNAPGSIATPKTNLKVVEKQVFLNPLTESVTVRDLAKALNALGVTPRDLVAIFQALKVAGALQAELVVM